MSILKQINTFEEVKRSFYSIVYRSLSTYNYVRVRWSDLECESDLNVLKI